MQTLFKPTLEHLLNILLVKIDIYREVVKELLANGANINTQMNTGVTALYLASQNGHIEVVKETIINVMVRLTLGIVLYTMPVKMDMYK